MPFTFQILPEKAVILARYMGLTTIRDMRVLAAEIWEHPDYDPAFDGILDYREAVLASGTGEIEAVCDFFLESEAASRGRAAVVVTRPRETALNVIFRARMNPRNRMDIFSTWDAACSFIGVRIPDPMRGVDHGVL